MNIRYTNHALQRLKDRGIRKDEVKRALMYPDAIIDKDDNSVVKKIRDNGHLLLVIFRESENTTIIITVIDTSKIKKYL